ncbi:MAG: hypothetical protein FWG56_02625 [Desulfovibrionaceae bacterium]|nr:hypothetical protein [Desulfovibrionaceae bacterium]
MSTNEEKPSYELSATEFEAEVSDMLKAARASHPISTEVLTALTIGFHATIRIFLDLGPDKILGHEALRIAISECDTLNNLLLEKLQGQLTRIDLVLWDATGYIHGWFLDQRGHLAVQLGSCPEVVAKLAAVLQTLSPYDQEWGALLKQRAESLVSLVLLARKKAELQARAKVQSQGWFKKLIFPTSLEKELLSLGFL